MPLTIWWDACGFAKQSPFEGHTGKGWTPRIPDAVLHANDRDVYAAFVRGLFEADGNASNGYAWWNTTSEEFSRDVQTLLITLGFVTTRDVGSSRAKWGAPCHRLRLLNANTAARFVDQIGFMSERKNGALEDADHPQAARHDHIPLTRETVDRLAPQNDELRKTMLTQLARVGAVSRRSATALMERQPTPELEQLLGYFYDEVASTELLEDQPTFDLSVPDNVTYVANGFVSHNTISFLMDCDTTGVEPDFSLVKFKELVGGGQMTIVNRTVPLALATLGYSDQQIEQIEAHLAEHGTIVGAPGLSEEHTQVFDVAVGERAISHMGHLEDDGRSAAVHLRRDLQDREHAAVIHGGGHLRRLHASVAARDQGARDLPRRLKDGAGAAHRRAAVRAGGARGRGRADREGGRQGAGRRRPAAQAHAAQRQSITHKFSIAGHEGYITAGMYEDGSVGEIFLTDIGKEGSTLRGMMNSFATAISIALQYGVPLETLVQKFSYMRFEPEGITGQPRDPVRQVDARLHHALAGLALPRRGRSGGTRHPHPRGARAQSRAGRATLAAMSADTAGPGNAENDAAGAAGLGATRMRPRPPRRSRKPRRSCPRACRAWTSVPPATSAAA